MKVVVNFPFESVFPPTSLRPSDVESNIIKASGIGTPSAPVTVTVIVDDWSTPTEIGLEVSVTESVGNALTLISDE